MKRSNQPLGHYEHGQDAQPSYLFSNQSDDDRKEEEAENEDEAATMDDWGDVDPAGGPAPSAPGSAV